MKHVRQSLFPLSDGFGIKGDDVSPRPAEKFLRCFKREIFESMPLILAFVGEEDERDEQEREEDDDEACSFFPFTLQTPIYTLITVSVFTRAQSRPDNCVLAHTQFSYIR